MGKSSSGLSRASLAKPGALTRAVQGIDKRANEAIKNLKSNAAPGTTTAAGLTASIKKVREEAQKAKQKLIKKMGQNLT